MSIFPDIELITEDVAMQELPILKEYAYDFSLNQLKVRDGKHYLVEENEALKIWIYKALVTMRYQYIAYTDDFGTEIYSVIGTTLSTEAKKAEVKRYVTEALMVNPYITAIEKIELEQDQAILNITVHVRSIYEDKVVNVSCSMQIA